MSEGTEKTEMYYLWPFAIGNELIITRGRTQDEAYRHIEPRLVRGVTVAFGAWNQVDAGLEYTRTHDFDWLHRKPKWLMVEDMVDAVMADKERGIRCPACDYSGIWDGMSETEQRHHLRATMRVAIEVLKF